jgi:hypothetical protein
MVSNCSHHRLEPLDPSIDPAYQDGPPPRPHRPRHAGELAVEWPAPWIPPVDGRLSTVSFEALEDALEREAAREETWA